MALPRLSVRWTARLVNQSVKASRFTPRSQSWQQIQRRAYASGGDHNTHKAGSDLPWAAGAVVVTVSSCYYLLQPDPNKSHEHGHGDGEHEKGDHAEHEEGDHGAAGRDDGDSREERTEDSTEAAGEEASKLQDNEVDNPEGSESSGGDEQDTPDTSDDEEAKNVPHVKEGGGNVEGVQFKGATKGGTEGGEQGDTRKHIPDAKGFNKKRIESDYGNKQGIADDEDGTRDEDGGINDKAAASKPPTGTNTQSNKQEGLSNTDTKHSTNITNDPEKSKKGEGTPETSKSKGTVDPGRPQV